MTLTDVVGAGRGALELIVDCAREIVRRAQATLSPLLTGRQPEPPASTARLAKAAQGPHEAVEATKFVAGSPGGGSSLGAASATLPRAYGVNRAVLTARDPCCLFVWWEITPVVSPGNFSLARSSRASISVCFIDSRVSRCTVKRL